MRRVGVLLGCCLIGCNGEPSSVSRVQVGDTVFVHSQSPRHPDTLEFALTQAWGTFDGPAEEEFSDIAAFAVSGAGDVYVFNGDFGLLRFDSEGRYVGRIASKGEGPAEVGCPLHIATNGDTVAVVDQCNLRVTQFTPGDEPRSGRMPEGRPRYGEDGLFFDSAGSLWIGLIPRPSRDQGVGFPRPAAARWTESGVLRDTVFIPSRYAERCPILSEWQYQAGYWEDKREQWYPKVKWAIGLDGSAAYGCPRKFEIDVVRPGMPILRVSRPWRPAETSEDERAFYQKWWQPLPPLPKLRPAYARIILTPDGRIWAWPELPSEQFPYDEQSQQMTGRTFGWKPAETGGFEVFEADGEWLGTVRLPEGVSYSGYPTTEPIVIRADTMWAIFQDSLDVQYVGRFVIRWPFA